MKRLTAALLALLFLASPACLNFFSASVAAASASNWQAGRIIDDAVFVDNKAMSVSQIQDFLNQKVGTGGYGKISGQCDSSGSAISEYGGGTREQYGAAHGNPGPFTCLKDYYEIPKTDPAPGIPVNNYGGKAIPVGAISSAQMIYNAAQKYKISPKVLLVTIQKESRGPLTTDDWPFLTQYTYAMGAYCPDSGPDNSANCDSNYAGFSIQIAESARLLRYYLDNMDQPWWTYAKLGDKAVQYSPHASCGSSNVTIATRATAALYTYTPYQPSQAALDNLYGSAPGDPAAPGSAAYCSAYGNRNFWRIFTDWFGTTRYSFGIIPSSKTSYATSPCNLSVYDANTVLRLYNPDTQDYLFTTNRDEACYAISYGYVFDGEVFTSVDPKDVNARAVYRLSYFGKHLYTTDQSIKDSYISKNWKDEGISFYGYSQQVAESVPVYQLGNDFTSLLTLYEGESKIMDSYLDMNLYGIAMYAPSKVKYSSENDVLRLRNKTTRLYTQSLIEKDSAQKAGFIDESIAFQSGSTATADSLPVYRLRNANNQYFYTNSRIERDLAVINYGYYSEGTGMLGKFSASSDGKSVYRLVNYSNGNRLYTVSTAERDNAINYYGYKFESVAWYQY